MASQIFRLVMRTGPNPGNAFELNQSIVTIGRDVANTIVINDAEISRKHVRIMSQAGGFVIEDTGSTNGTYINGQRLMGPHLLRPGELVVLGENVSLIYETFQFDPDATVAVTPGQYPNAPYPPAYPPAYPPTYPPMVETAVPPAPAAPRQTAPLPYSYSGQIPSGPVEEYEEVEEKPRNRRTLIIVGCGCLVIMLCLLVGAGMIFDYLNLYCSGPFRYIFPCQ